VRRNLLVYTGITPVKSDIGNDHQAVEDVEVDDEIKTVQDFVGYTCGVADKDNEKKDDAFTGVFARCIRFIDRERPRGAKTEKHNDFKDTHTSVNSFTTATLRLGRATQPHWIFIRSSAISWASS
jgi:hypothetical protein